MCVGPSANFAHRINGFKEYSVSDYVKLPTWGLLASFGEVESTGTSMRRMEGPSLSNSAVFPTFRWTGKRCETSKRPRFTKTGQEPTWDD